MSDPIEANLRQQIKILEQKLICYDKEFGTKHNNLAKLNRELMETNQELKLQKSQLEIHYQSLVKSYELQNQRVQELESEKLAYQHEQSQIDGLHAEIDYFRQIAQKYRLSSRKKKTQLRHLTGDLTNLKSKLIASDTKQQQGYQTQVEKLQGKCQQFIDQQNQFQQEISDLKKKLRESQLSNETLEMKLSAMVSCDDEALKLLSYIQSMEINQAPIQLFNPTMRQLLDIIVRIMQKLVRYKSEKKHYKSLSNRKEESVRQLQCTIEGLKQELNINEQHPEMDAVVKSIVDQELKQQILYIENEIQHQKDLFLEQQCKYQEEISYKDELIKQQMVQLNQFCMQSSEVRHYETNSSKKTSLHESERRNSGSADKIETLLHGQLIKVQAIEVEMDELRSLIDRFR